MALVLVACTPRVDPQGPGPLPDPIEGAAPAEGAERLPARSAAPAAPPPSAPAPAPAIQPTAPPLPGPTQATLTLKPAKGSKAAGAITILAADDKTELRGTITGLAKKATYTFRKTDSCFAHKADDDSKRSSAVAYVITIVANDKGEASISDSTVVLHLDGPQALPGAIFVVTASRGNAVVACGRVQ
ncbi:MAG: hypothetical protein H0T46_21655 [Deltaproteobacteria bacterium]|nr:hypothetical protein [Deltaproteobacteria bacterium]